MIAEMVEWAALSGRSFRVPGATMATYTLPLTGSLHKSVANGTTDTINVPAGRGPKVVRIVNVYEDGYGVYVRGDSITAVIGADGTYRLVGPTPMVDLVVQPGNYISICPGADVTGRVYNYTATLISG